VRSYKNYSEDFKKAAIQKLLSPNGPGATKLSKDLGLHLSTLYSWKQKYASTQFMKKSNKKEWTPEQMLEAIIKTASMNEQELGEYLRSNGLLSSELEAFKNDFINFKKEKKRGRPQLDPEVVKLRKQEKQLQRELRKTQTALAEQSARIILLKKSHEIWGTNEDDE
jgi:transposase-like protein